MNIYNDLSNWSSREAVQVANPTRHFKKLKIKNFSRIVHDSCSSYILKYIKIIFFILNINILKQ